MWTTAEAAIEIRDALLKSSKGKRNLGDYVTALALPDSVKCEQRGDDPRHYEIWAPAEEIWGYRGETRAITDIQSGQEQK